MKLVALKELRYAGATYLPGAMFEAADKDARLLKAVKRAADASTKPAKPAHVDIPAPPAKEAEEPSPEFVPGHYQRRDMRAEDGRTGEATSLQSLRRGRPRKEPNSDD